MTQRIINIFIRNLGCKVNLADAAAVVDWLPPDRCRLVNNAHAADVVLLNTCTVTHKADRDVRKILGSLLHKHPAVSVVMTGCGVENDRLDFNRYSNIRASIPPGYPQVVAAAVLDVTKQQHAQGQLQYNPQPSSFFRLGRQRAFVKVQDGCNSRCAYCIVPYTRGNERSLETCEAVNQVRSLIDQGHREIVLTGVHLGRYGSDLTPQTSLAELLEALACVFQRLGPGFRLRMSSIEPLEWSQSLFEAIHNFRFVCDHFHIPLQSGDDAVLQNMRRPYRARHFQDIVMRLHEHFPSASLGTDVLVGFPGESEPAAENTYQLLSSLPISYLHVFTYSPRPGTPAATMNGRVEHAVVRARALRLRKLSKQHWQHFLHQCLGQPHQVLIEKQTPSGWFGRSGNYCPFQLASNVGRPGQLVDVMAKKVYKGSLIVELCCNTSRL